jgi:tetratricopeptide (TPR) repeat protein
MKTHLILSAALVQFVAVAQTLSESQCTGLNELASTRAVANRLDQTEVAVSLAMSRGDYVCAGIVLGNIAALMSTYGRVSDSEAFATRAIDLLRKHLDPADPIFFRPLHVLAITRLEQGKFRKAQKAFEQMLQIPANRPEQRAQVHITRGMLLQMQGKFKDAESEYLLADDEWTQLGRPADADAAAVLSYLGALYIAEARFKEASQVLDRALALIEVAKNAVPLDRINLLNRRAVAHGKEGEWPQAQEKLRQAIAIAESAGVSEPVMLRSVFDNYAFALRKNHHRREARVIDGLSSALPRDPAGAVIDVQELSAARRARQH